MKTGTCESCGCWHNGTLYGSASCAACLLRMERLCIEILGEGVTLVRDEDIRVSLERSLTRAGYSDAERERTFLSTCSVDREGNNILRTAVPRWLAVCELATPAMAPGKIVDYLRALRTHPLTREALPFLFDNGGAEAVRAAFASL